MFRESLHGTFLSIILHCTQSRSHVLHGPTQVMRQEEMNYAMVLLLQQRNAAFLLGNLNNLDK
jgi:hypothetical protein